jgi:hypothetical protein
VNPALVAVAVAVIVAGVVAVSAREQRLALIALAAALVGSALLADPLPGPAILSIRVVAALLAFAILWPVAATRTPEGLPALGGPAEAIIAFAGAVIGLAVAISVATLDVTGVGGIEQPDLGAGLAAAGASAAAAMAGMALAVVALPVAAGETSALRRAIGGVLLIQGIAAVAGAVAGAPPDLGQLVLVGLLVATAAAGAALAHPDEGDRHSAAGHEETA